MKKESLLLIVAALSATATVACAQVSGGAGDTPLNTPSFGPLAATGGAPLPPPVGGPQGPGKIAPPPPPPGGPRQPGPPETIASMSINGNIKSYLQNPGGQVDGILMNDGKQLHFPPHLGESVMLATNVGDGIDATVEPGAQSQYGQEYRTISLTDKKSGATVADQPPAAPLGAPPAPPSASKVVKGQGALSCFLVGHAGEINGLLLSDGTQVHFAPTVRSIISSQMKIGDRVVAQGYGTHTKVGTSLDATALNVNGKTLPLSGVITQ